MRPPAVRDRLKSYLPFVVVVLLGQLSVALPPGPTDRYAFVVSTVLIRVLRRREIDA